MSGFDKERDALNVLSIEKEVCFSLLKNTKVLKSVGNIFFMFEKQNSMKHTVKTSKFILIRSNMKNSTVKSVQLELNGNCFIT